MVRIRREGGLLVFASRVKVIRGGTRRSHVGSRLLSDGPPLLFRGQRLSAKRREPSGSDISFDGAATIAKMGRPGRFSCMISYSAAFSAEMREGPAVHGALRL